MPINKGRILLFLICIGIFSLVSLKVFSDTPQNSEIIVEDSPPDFQKQSERFSQKLLISRVDESLQDKQLITVYDDGFLLKGIDDELRIGGWAQVGYGASEHSRILSNAFFVRRARIDFRGVLEYHWNYRIYGAFGGSGAKLQEAWLEYSKYPFLRIRLGQYKEPFSMEAVFSSRWTLFAERAMGPTNLAPKEDIGLQVFGKLFENSVVYAFGVFNGRGKNLEENNENKEVAGRVTWAPFDQCKKNSLLKGVNIGMSSTIGRPDALLSRRTYRTGSRSIFLTFSDDTFQKGEYLRYGGELEWIWRTFKLQSEYIYAKRKKIIRDEISSNLINQSWYVGIGWLMTGDEQVSNHFITPNCPFNSNGGYGAWELAVRYDEFHSNKSAFDKDIVSGAHIVRSGTIGLNWWPNFHIKGTWNVLYNSYSDDLVISGKSFDHDWATVLQFLFNY